MLNASHIEDLLARLPKKGRALIGIAGAPGSGKSTIAHDLAQQLQPHGRWPEVVPMDGFHLDNRLLKQRDLLHRKGAPETFDLQGFIHLIKRLRNEETVIYPLFERENDVAIAGAGEVGENCDCVIVEGNYLLFDELGWRELAPLFDVSIRLDLPEEVLRARLIQRWRRLGASVEAAQKRTDSNDMANAKRMLTAELPADLTWG